MKTPQVLLKEIAAIRAMERGSLSRMRSGPYFNHQTWQKGRNRVRYVPKSELPALRDAIAGYRRFLTLTRQYADLIIQRSRAQRAAARARMSAGTPGRAVSCAYVWATISARSSRSARATPRRRPCGNRPRS
jgi:hypothetical protein